MIINEFMALNATKQTKHRENHIKEQYNDNGLRYYLDDFIFSLLIGLDNVI